MDTDEQEKMKSSQKGSNEAEGDSGKGKLTRSTAENTSFEEGAGENATGHDSPPVTSSTLSNAEVHSGEYDPQGDDEQFDSEPKNKDRHDSGRG